MDKYVFIDSRLRKFELEKIKELGYKVILLEKQNHVYPEISGHADIFIFKINNKLFIEEKMYESLLENSVFNELVDKSRNQIEIIKIVSVGDKYPEDIKLNAAVVGKYIFHNLKYTDKNLLSLFNEYKYINVKQGYTNCSTAVIDDNSIITSDIGIYKACQQESIDSLFIKLDKGEIKLFNSSEKYSDMEGFIGGAVAKLGNNIIIFGDIKKLHEFEKIEEFIKNKNLNIISFDGEDIVDYGGLVEIKIIGD